MHTHLEVISVGPSAKQRLLAGRGPMPQDLQKNRRHQKSKHGSFHQTRGAKGANGPKSSTSMIQRTSFWPHRRKFINQRSASAPSRQSRDSLCNLNTWSLPALRSQTGCNVVDTSAVAQFNTPDRNQISTPWFRLHILSDHSIAASWAMTLGVDSKVTVPNSGGTSHTDLVVFHAHLKVLTHLEIFVRESFKDFTWFDVSKLYVQVHQVHQTDWSQCVKRLQGDPCTVKVAKAHPRRACHHWKTSQNCRCLQGVQNHKHITWKWYKIHKMFPLKISQFTVDILDMSW